MNLPESNTSLEDPIIRPEPIHQQKKDIPQPTHPSRDVRCLDWAGHGLRLTDCNADSVLGESLTLFRYCQVGFRFPNIALRRSD